MTGYTFLFLNELGIDTDTLHDYGKSTGDYLGTYKGYWGGFYWFSNF